MLRIKRSQLRELAKNKFGIDNIENQNQILIMISVSLAARTSYTTVGDEKEIDYKKLIELHDRLITQDPLHASPMEHCARAMTEQEYDSYLRSDGSVDTYGWCRNFKGFISYRHLIEEL